MDSSYDSAEISVFKLIELLEDLGLKAAHNDSTKEFFVGGQEVDHFMMRQYEKNKE